MAIFQHDNLVGAKGVRLSGGQIQRAAAARMFVRAPELLVFDDLSSALDVETERSLWERIENAKLKIENDAGNDSFSILNSRSFPPPRRSAPRRSHYCAEGWSRGVGGYARSAAGDQP